MTIEVKKDGEGFLAKVRGDASFFAFGFSKAEAVMELGSVVEMVDAYRN